MQTVRPQYVGKSAAEFYALMLESGASAYITALETLQKASNKMAEQLYKQQAEAGGAQAGANGNGHANGANGQAKEDKKDGDDVIDADFKEL